MHRLKSPFILAALILIPGCSLLASKDTTRNTEDAARASFVSANGTVVARAELDAFVDRQMADLDMPGLSIAVISDGEIVYTRATGIANRDTGSAVDEDSIFEAASLSKPVFAYFVLRLVGKGVLNLDVPLHTYLPMEELAYDPRYRSVTARMVLSHTTGFPNWRWFDPAPVERNIERGTMYMKRNPGEFGYSGEGYNYLAEVIAHLTNNDMTTIDDLFQEEVAKPLGMQHSAFVRTGFIGEHKVSGHKQGKVADDRWPRSFPDDTPLTFGAAGRLHTNAQDYALFMTGMIEGRGLRPELRNEFFKEQSRLPEDSETRRLTGETAWGLGIAIEPTPYGIRYEHGGNNGNFQSGMMVFLESGLGFVFFTNS
ncbi:MAG: beta-lactamase family protein, partial [Gammaproteobacteria bacterium]|nr:beta-lactamase family protein [Gammaproteobacteria bacterium]